MSSLRHLTSHYRPPLAPWFHDWLAENMPPEDGFHQMRYQPDLGSAEWLLAFSHLLCCPPVNKNTKQWSLFSWEVVVLLVVDTLPSKKSTTWPTEHAFQLHLSSIPYSQTIARHYGETMFLFFQNRNNEGNSRVAVLVAVAVAVAAAAGPGAAVVVVVVVVVVKSLMSSLWCQVFVVKSLLCICCVCRCRWRCRCHCGL